MFASLFVAPSFFKSSLELIFLLVELSESAAVRQQIQKCSGVHKKLFYYFHEHKQKAVYLRSSAYKTRGPLESNISVSWALIGP